MKNIVVLVDFSDVTFLLLRQAYDFANAFGSHVVLLHATPPEPVVVDFGMNVVTHEPASPEKMDSERSKLEQLRESLVKFGVETSVRQIQGNEWSDLAEECENLRADLIVVGSHGHGSLYNLLVGSMSAEMVSRAPCPILVVPKASDRSAAKAEASSADTVATSTGSTAGLPQTELPPMVLPPVP